MEYTFGIPLSGKVTVDAEEREKCHDDHDKMWFNRCIQELEWVLQMKDKPTHNCYMQSNAATQDMTGTGQYINIEGK